MENKESRDLDRIGNSMIAHKAQSGLITEIGDTGQKVLQPPMEIVGYEIISEFGEPELMLILDSKDGLVSVYEEFLINLI